MFRSPSKNDAFLGIKKYVMFIYYLVRFWCLIVFRQVDELLSSSEQFMVHLQEKTISKEDRNVIIKQINTNIVATEDLLSCSERLKGICYLVGLELLYWLAVDKEGSKSEERIAYVENSRNRINQIKTALVSPISRVGLYNVLCYLLTITTESVCQKHGWTKELCPTVIL